MCHNLKRSAVINGSVINGSIRLGHGGLKSHAILLDLVKGFPSDPSFSRWATFLT